MYEIFQSTLISFFQEVTHCHLELPQYLKTWFSPPFFLKVFNDARINPGDRVMFECVLLGKPRPKAVWLFNESPIVYDDITVFNTCDECRLTIARTTVKHYGKYTLVAENEAGKLTCSAWLLMPRS
ncbi:unnamed protein product [Soboliphyme baturini]|uniref:Ig-like domain-containing protein n=1 Tax=Soboliphyme baturini TaxID=241478 RepID=A0A183IPI5_9BILA|nr:unnamed protein product [Soboliphyme baturini]